VARRSDDGGTEPPGRRERKKERTRRELVDAAVRLFAERGFEETTVEDISNAADVSPRTFFRYFRTKEEVLFSDHPRTVEVLKRTLEERPEDERILRSVAAGMAAVARTFEEDPEAYLTRVRLDIQSPTVAASALHIQQDWARVIARFVAARLGVDPRRDLRPGLVSGAAVAAFRAAVTRWASGRGSEDAAALVDEAFQLLGSGLGLPGSGPGTGGTGTR